MSHKLAKITKVIVVLIALAIAGFVAAYLSSSVLKHSEAKSTTSITHKAPNSTVSEDTGLHQIIDKWAKGQSFNSSVVVRELTGQQRSANLNPAKPMTTASTYKIFVAYAVLHEVEQGNLSLESQAPYRQTVSANLNNMIINSSNVSAEALGFMVGWDKIDALAAAVGATHTDINNYDSAGNPTQGNKTSTATDLALMLTKLERGKLLNKSDSSFLLNLMENQVYRERIPAGVPSSVVVADKPGWLAPADGYDGYVENDAAIVYGPKSTYVLVIMTSGGSTTPLANLSQQVYNYLES